MNRLFLGMDGTLAPFHNEVQYLERMWEKDFFRNLKPFQNMIDAVKWNLLKVDNWKDDLIRNTDDSDVITEQISAIISSAPARHQARGHR